MYKLANYPGAVASWGAPPPKPPETTTHSHPRPFATAGPQQDPQGNRRPRLTEGFTPVGLSGVAKIS